MKILHIAQSLLGGGVQNLLLSLLPEQVKMGDKVGLIVIDKYSKDYCYELEKKLIDRGVLVFRLDKKVGSKLSFLKTSVKCRSIVRKFKPDVLNSHTTLPDIYGAVSLLFSNVPQIITVHNGPEPWGLLNNLLNRNAPLIFCSQSAYELRLQKNKDITAIDNGVSEEIVRSNMKVDLRKELGLGECAKIVVSIGSLRPQKNYALLKDIVKELDRPDVHFCVCGGHYGKGYVDIKEFAEYKKNIHFMGLRADVSQIENGSNLFLSCAKFEGLPIAVLEAFFNGIPCVLSPIPQHQKIVKGVDAVYIPDSFDAKDFAKAIREALGNQLSHDRIYENRKEIISQFSISETARRYQDFYTKHLK